MHIASLQHAEELLMQYVPAVKTFTGKNITLERIKPLMQKIGNPENKLKIIHIAGTSGKTSTCYYIASLLIKNKHTVGLTVSPHIDKITERIQLNGKPITDKAFCDYLGEFLEYIVDLAVQPSYFELLMALSYWIFEKEGVEYAVIETGMGGLHDGSNVAERQDKVCVITDIGYDHMHILGTTISEITAQKAGIIHGGNVVFMHKQSHNVMDVVRRKIEEQAASLYFAEEVFINEVGGGVGILPDFQKRNFVLALSVVAYVLYRDGYGSPSKNSINDTLHAYIPARMDTVRINQKTLIMDGAHNGQKMKSLVQSYQKQYGSLKAAVLLSLKNGKEYEEVLDILKPITEKLILTTFSSTQDLPSHAIDPRLLETHAIKLGYEHPRAANAGN
jgi:dihydrofolate synthase/folylpolyglutamate synthase